MFVYPETMQTDAVEDFHEADSLQQHLDAMFAEDAPPLDWDTDQQYTRSNLELYYLAYAAKPLLLQQLTEVCCSFGLYNPQSFNNNNDDNNNNSNNHLSILWQLGLQFAHSHCQITCVGFTHSTDNA